VRHSGLADADSQLLFFYLYGVITLLALFLDSGIIPTSSPTYPVRRCSSTDLIGQWFAAVYTAFVAAMFWCLLVNGFVGFQFAEDGTPLSLWVRFRTSSALTGQFLRLSSLAIFGIVFFIAIATFKSFAGFAPDKALGLWIIMLCVRRAVARLTRQHFQRHLRPRLHHPPARARVEDARRQVADRRHPVRHGLFRRRARHHFRLLSHDVRRFTFASLTRQLRCGQALPGRSLVRRAADSR